MPAKMRWAPKCHPKAPILKRRRVLEAALARGGRGQSKSFSWHWKLVLLLQKFISSTLKSIYSTLKPISSATKTISVAPAPPGQCCFEDAPALEDGCSGVAFGRPSHFRGPSYGAAPELCAVVWICITQGRLGELALEG